MLLLEVLTAPLFIRRVWGTVHSRRVRRVATRTGTPHQGEDFCRASGGEGAELQGRPEAGDGSGEGFDSPQDLLADQSRTIGSVCEVLGVSRSTLYKLHRAQRDRKDAARGGFAERVTDSVRGEERPLREVIRHKDVQRVSQPASLPHWSTVLQSGALQAPNMQQNSLCGCRFSKPNFAQSAPDNATSFT